MDPALDIRGENRIQQIAGGCPFRNPKDCPFNNKSGLTHKCGHAHVRLQGVPSEAHNDNDQAMLIKRQYTLISKLEQEVTRLKLFLKEATDRAASFEAQQGSNPINWTAELQDMELEARRWAEDCEDDLWKARMSELHTALGLRAHCKLQVESKHRAEQTVSKQAQVIEQQRVIIEQQRLRLHDLEAELQSTNHKHAKLVPTEHVVAIQNQLHNEKLKNASLEERQRSLEQTIRDLEDQLGSIDLTEQKKLKAQIQRSSEQYALLEMRYKEAERQMAEGEEAKKLLKSQNVNLQKSHQELIEQLHAAYLKYSVLESRLKELEEQSRSKEMDLEQIRSKDTELEQSRSKQMELERKLQLAKQERQKLEEQLRSLQQDKTPARHHEPSRDQKQKEDVLNQTISRQANVLEQQVAQITEQRAKMQKLEDELLMLRQSQPESALTSELASELSSVKQRYQNLETRYEALKRSHQSLERTNDEADMHFKEQRKLKSEHEMLESQHRKLQMRYASLEEETVELRRKLGSIENATRPTKISSPDDQESLLLKEKQIEKLRFKYEQLEEEYQTLKAKHASEMENKEQKLRELEQRIVDELDTNDTNELEARLREELENKVRKNLQGEMEAQHQKLEAKQSALELMKAELEAQRSKLEAQQSKLEAGRSELEAEQSKLESQKLELEAQRSKLESQRSQVEAERSALEALKEELQAERTRMDVEKARILAVVSDVEAEQTKLQKAWETLNAERQAGNVRGPPRPASGGACVQCAQLEQRMEALQQETSQLVESTRAEMLRQVEALELDRRAFEAQKQALLSMAGEAQQGWWADYSRQVQKNVHLIESQRSAIQRQLKESRTQPEGALSAKRATPQRLAPLPSSLASGPTATALMERVEITVHQLVAGRACFALADAHQTGSVSLNQLRRLSDLAQSRLTAQNVAVMVQHLTAGQKETAGFWEFLAMYFFVKLRLAEYGFALPLWVAFCTRSGYQRPNLRFAGGPAIQHLAPLPEAPQPSTAHAKHLDPRMTYLNHTGTFSNPRAPPPAVPLPAWTTPDSSFH